MTIRSIVRGTVAVCLACSSAFAQPAPPPAPSDPTAMEPPGPPPAAEPTMVQKLTLNARTAARDGRCDMIPMIGARVRQIDPSYYSTVFVVDLQIASCRQGQPFRPPSSAAVITAPVAANVDDELLPSEIIEVKSPSTAIMLSLGITVGGLGLAYLADEMDRGTSDSAGALGTLGGIAFMVGPTTGHIYAGNTWNTGLKWRLGGLGVGLGGIVFALSQCDIFEGCTEDEEDAADVGAAIAVGGVIMYAGGTIYEIATAGRSAREYNIEYSRRRLQMQIVPMAGRSPGLTLAGTF